jgi:lipopolysaccharide transport system ATP-binding protein
MATDALQQNPGYVDGESIFLLDTAASPLAQQIETRLRHLVSQPHKLRMVGESGQTFTRQRYAPERQIGERQRILRDVAAQLVAQPRGKAT